MTRVGEQRIRSLTVANQTRTARATLKNELATGHAQIEDVLTDPPPCAATAQVSELLLAIRGVGPKRVTRALARCRIPYAQTAAGLSERQLAALIALLANRASPQQVEEQS
ncbi:MAG TPA: hypothetical protein VIM33_01330 [Gaiellaceae bacterium]